MSGSNSDVSSQGDSDNSFDEYMRGIGTAVAAAVRELRTNPPEKRKRQNDRFERVVKQPHYQKAIVRIITHSGLYDKDTGDLTGQGTIVDALKAAWRKRNNGSVDTSDDQYKMELEASKKMEKKKRNQLVKGPWPFSKFYHLAFPDPSLDPCHMRDTPTYTSIGSELEGSTCDFSIKYYELHGPYRCLVGAETSKEGVWRIGTCSVRPFPGMEKLKDWPVIPEELFKPDDSRIYELEVNGTNEVTFPETVQVGRICSWPNLCLTPCLKSDNEQKRLRKERKTDYEAAYKKMKAKCTELKEANRGYEKEKARTNKAREAKAKKRKATASSRKEGASENPYAKRLAPSRRRGERRAVSASD